MPTEIVSELPRIQVVSREIPTSGLSYWDRQRWMICLNRSEPATRQRFTLFHEYKHIIDHGRTGTLYGEDERRAEQAADYFAGCVLLPRTLLKRAWARGIQRPSGLAMLFDVSERAAAVRLAQVGLSDPVRRCSTAHPSLYRRFGTYQRQPSADWPRVPALGIAS